MSLLSQCTGYCRGFENNNRCDVDNTDASVCPSGTDCADCSVAIIVWQILGISLVFIQTVLMAYLCLLFCRYRSMKMQQASEEEIETER